jgi:hypothetical protein
MVPAFINVFYDQYAGKIGEAGWLASIINIGIDDRNVISLELYHAPYISWPFIVRNNHLPAAVVAYFKLALTVF